MNKLSSYLKIFVTPVRMTREPVRVAIGYATTRGMWFTGVTTGIVNLKYNLTGCKSPKAEELV